MLYEMVTGQKAF